MIGNDILVRMFIIKYIKEKLHHMQTPGTRPPGYPKNSAPGHPVIEPSGTHTLGYEHHGYTNTQYPDFITLWSILERLRIFYNIRELLEPSRTFDNNPQYLKSILEYFKLVFIRRYS